LAVEAYEEALITEGQLAKFLECDRVTARSIAEKHSRQIEVNNSGQIEEARYNAQKSLLSGN
jgi:hypothetical protein